MEGSNLYPVYLAAEQTLDLAGFSFSAAGDGARFRAAITPSIADDGIPDAVAMAWLDSFHVQRGQRILLGHVESRSMPRLIGASADTTTESFAVELSSRSSR